MMKAKNRDRLGRRLKHRSQRVVLSASKTAKRPDITSPDSAAHATSETAEQATPKPVFAESDKTGNYNAPGQKLKKPLPPPIRVIVEGGNPD